jgi:Ca2+-binding RTX toxin-like protein
VNGTTVNCVPPDPNVVPTFLIFQVQFAGGTDSFTNDGLEISGQIIAFGETGSKTVDGGPGSQVIGGGLDSDSIDGGAGDDTLFDGGGSDTAPTGGNDLLVGGAGEDSTNYGRGPDVPMTVTLDLQGNDGQPGEADNVQVENISTGDGDDTIVGDAAANQLIAFGGADSISAGAGNDTLVGDDTFGGGLVLIRGLAAPAINDTLNGGPGRDSIDCGNGYDLALRDPFDEVEPNCDRIGADLAGESSGLSGKKKNKAKILVECPESEGTRCEGRLKLTANDRKLGKGKFKVAPGASKFAKAKLTKKGLRALDNAGGALLCDVTVTTTEPGGVAVSVGRLLIHQ